MWKAEKFGLRKSGVLLSALMLFSSACSLKQADESVVGKSAAFRTSDGQSISKDDSEEYNPFVVQKTDGYLIAIFGSDRACGGCTTGKHHLFVATSVTAYANNGVLPFFNSPQALTVGGAEQYWSAAITFAAVVVAHLRLRCRADLRRCMNKASMKLCAAPVTKHLKR